LYNVKPAGVVVTAYAPTMVPVNVSATVHIPIGTTVATVLSNCANAYTAYLNNIGLSSTGTAKEVDYFTIGSLFLEQAGVTKIDNLLIGKNSGTSPYYGTASTATGTTTLTDTTASWTTNAYVGMVVTSENSFGVVSSNTSTVLTVSSWTNGTPVSGTSYSITTVPAGTADISATFGNQLIAGAVNLSVLQP
jgi:hypothetical protein